MGALGSHGGRGHTHSHTHSHTHTNTHTQTHSHTHTLYSLGWEPLVAMGGVESMTAAAVAALLGGMWAKGLPQTQRNLLIEQQVKAIYSSQSTHCAIHSLRNLLIEQQVKAIYSLSSNLLIAQSTHLLIYSLRNLLIAQSTHCATYSLSSR